MCCDDCLNRRKFLTLAAAAGATVALAACGDGELSGVQPTNTGTVMGPTKSNPTSKLTLKVGDYSELAQTDVLVQVTSTFVAVKRTGASTFDAFSMSCTHQGCLTSLVNGNRFDCPCHFSQFDVNGAVIHGPSSGEAIDPLTKFPTAYDVATDILTIN